MREPEDEADRKVLDDIATYGWHVVKIGPLDDMPGWAFTIGLFETFKAPELIVFGDDLRALHCILNVVGEQAKEGQRLVDGDRRDDVLQDMPCAFRTAKRRWYAPLLGYALWLYRGDDFPVLQCIWPDREGRLPWEIDFDPRLRDVQPSLWEWDEDAAGMTALLASL